MIYDVNNLDILGVRNDGRVELVIISTGGLDDSAETQSALLDKIQNYLGYVQSGEFTSEFGYLPKEKVHIILKVDEPLSVLHEQLLERIVPWVSENGATMKFELIEKG